MRAHLRGLVVPTVLGSVLLALLGILLWSSFRESSARRDVAATTLVTESTATNLVSTMRDSLDLVAAVDGWLGGSGPRRAFQIPRALLEQRLSVKDVNGSTAADAMSPRFMSALSGLDAALAGAPRAALTPAQQLQWRSRVAAALKEFNDSSRAVVTDYRRAADAGARQYAADVAATERRQTVLLLGVLLLATLTLGWIAAVMLSRQRRERASLAADRHALVAAQQELARTSMLERGQGEILEQIATGEPSAGVLDAIAALASSVGGGTYELVTADGHRAGPSRGPEAASVLWSEQVGPEGESRHTGRIWLLGRPGETATEHQVHVGHRCAGLATVLLERDAAAERLSYQADHDSLTGLPNRARLLDRLDAVLTSGHDDVAVLFCDLDGFKVVNDSLGHKAGDLLLVRAAARLEAALRAGDLVARLGGDEFVVVTSGARAASEAVRMAERIVTAFARPFDIDGREAFVSVSVGVAHAPTRSITAASLLRNADVAMYSIKRRDKGGWAVFDAVMEHEAAQRLELDTALRHATSAGQLSLMLQPVVRLSDRSVTGMEALVRWDRPGHGSTSPDLFIPAAEQNGLVVEIGRWVLVESLSWLRRHLDTEPWSTMSVAVNVSARQLRDAGFEQDVLSALLLHGIEPESLVLELTETTLLDAGPAADVLARLRSVGVRIALDDFGTGHSSLTRLRTLPVDIIKLDRSFVAPLSGPDPHQAAIVEAVVRLAAALELTLVVEGVETEAEAATLRALGCERVQGFLFGRPQPAVSWLPARDRTRVPDRMSLAADAVPV